MEALPEEGNPLRPEEERLAQDTAAVAYVGKSPAIEKASLAEKGSTAGSDTVSRSRSRRRDLVALSVSILLDGLRSLHIFSGHDTLPRSPAQSSSRARRCRWL